MRRYAAIVVSIFVGSCNATLSYPTSLPESGSTCTDGIDNDLDGLTDCDDDSCDCNRCGEFVVPEVGPLGRTCSLDCECEAGEVCNPSASACIREPTPEENAFEIQFVQRVRQSELGTWIAEAPDERNALGTLRFSGATFDVSDVVGVGSDQLFFAGAEDDDRIPLLRFGYSGQPEPDERDARSFQLDDGLSPPNPEGTTSIASDFSYLPPETSEVEQRLNILAVASAATLELDPLSETEPGYWRGRVYGTLRGATSYDRGALGGGCTGGKVFFPELGRCADVREPTLDNLFLFACPFTEEPPHPRAGGFVFVYRPDDISNQARTGINGDCAARRVDDDVEIVARSGPAEAVVSLRIEIPSANLVSNVRRGLPGPGLHVTLHSHDPDARPENLFELQLGAPNFTLNGSIDIETVTEGKDGVLIGWVAGSLETP